MSGHRLPEPNAKKCQDIGKRGQERGTRELVVAGLPYIVIYAVQREELVILRVLHTSMKYP